MRIKEAHIFVGDLTFINKETFLTKIWKKLRGIKYKVTPNPNVINESALFIGRGYTKYQAIHVLNTKFGDPNKDVNLIFADKRDKRFPLTFRLDEYNGKTPKNNYDKEQKKLIKELTVAIKGCAVQAVFHLDEDIKPFVLGIVINLFRVSGIDYIQDGLEQYLNAIKNNKDNLRISGLSGFRKNSIWLWRLLEMKVLSTYTLT